jgi:hypothetical protein
MVVRFVCVIRRVCPCVPVYPVCVPAPPRVFLPVKRHRGAPGHTRDRHPNRTNRTPTFYRYGRNLRPTPFCADRPKTLHAAVGACFEAP